MPNDKECNDASYAKNRMHLRPTRYSPHTFGKTVFNRMIMMIILQRIV